LFPAVHDPAKKTTKANKLLKISRFVSRHPPGLHKTLISPGLKSISVSCLLLGDPDRFTRGGFMKQSGCYTPGGSNA
jgi:hypothetical protein